MRVRDIGVLLGAMLGLSGCGVVVSAKPLFQQGAAILRPGLWAGLDDKCAVPTDARFAAWPECAKPLIVSGNDVTSPRETGRVRFVLTDTKPAIVQIELKDGITPAAGPPPSPDAKPSPPIYLYGVAKFAANRPITDIAFVPLDCPKASIPGLKVEKRLKNQIGDSSCTATTPAAVVAVARAAPIEKTMRMVWIADAPAK